MSKPSLIEEFQNNGDIRVIIDLVKKYKYTDDEASELINYYKPYNINDIPEVEHIEVMLYHFPNALVTQSTLNAIKHSFPNRLEYILSLMIKH